MVLGGLIGERFAIERLAGAGGMGTVYKGTDLTTGQPVAIKMMRDPRGHDRERFEREARVLSDLSHPGIVRYLAHGTRQGGELYLAMEWLEGQDLGQRLAQAPLTTAESIAVIRRAAEALAAAHARGVVHRDIKPSNLFLVGGLVERVKLLDFGVARLRGDSRGDVRSATALGTPGYMAPEQARGERQLDTRADVFSLGCVLFECLTGTAAFTGEHVMALLAKILLEETPRPSKLRATVPPWLDALAGRMLAKDPGARPRDGAAVVAELTSIDAASSEEVSGRSLAPGTLSSGEQRLLSVIVIHPPEAADKRDPSAPDEIASPGTVDASSAQRIAVGHEGGGEGLLGVRRIAERFAARFEPLAGGAMVLTLSVAQGASDQAAHAARCGLALRAHLPEETIAIATGRGVVGERLLIGEVLERAARLTVPNEGATPPLRIDEVTAGLLDDRFALGADAAGLVLLCEQEPREVTRTLLGRPTTCVGRQQELSILGAYYQECATESVARAVLVTAPPGVGKSRLRYEFLRSIRPAKVWLGRGDPMSVGSPFGTIAPAILYASGCAPGDPIAVRQLKLRARVARHVHDADVGRVSEFIGEMIGVPFSDEQSVQLRAARHDPLLMADQIRRAFEDLLAAECAAEPLVIAIDDMHWGDRPTVNLLDGALRNLKTSPLLVLALARPDVHVVFPKLWVGRALTELKLAVLARRAGDTLVREALGPTARADVVDRIVTLAGGNAFYLEELIRAVVEGRGDRLPDTVLAMVQARLEGLEGEARRILRAAAVFGQVFWDGGLAALLGGDESFPELGRWLALLVERELVTRRPDAKFAGEKEYIFRHALLRDAAYATLTDADRELGHALAAGWLERSGELDAVVLAEHLERAGAPERAVEQYRRAAEQAVEGNDLEAALSRARRCLDCGAEGVTRGEMLRLQAEVQSWLGDLAGTERSALAARDHLALGSPSWFTATGLAVTAASSLGHGDRLRELAEELRVSWSSERPSGSQVVATARAAIRLRFAGAEALAGVLGEKIDAISAEVVESDPAAAAWVHQVSAWRSRYAGDPAACLQWFARAAQSADQAGDERLACLQRENSGAIYVELGLYEDAERMLRSSLLAAERMNLTRVAAVAKHNLGPALAGRGALEEARAMEADAVALVATQGEQRLEGGSRLYLASILLQLGDIEVAEREARAALDVLKAVPPLRAMSLAVLAEVLLAAGRSVEALAPAKEARALLDSLGALEEGEALLRLVHAEVLHATGEVEPARAAIVAARDRLLARAERITDAAWRETYLTRVRENARTLQRAAEWLEA